MQTSTQRSIVKRRAPKAAPALPYPYHFEHPERLNWLCHYFCDLAELEALTALSSELSRRNRSHIVRMAVIGAKSEKRVSIKRSLGYVVSNGLLPFAHAQTTVFEAAGVTS